MLPEHSIFTTLNNSEFYPLSLILEISIFMMSSENRSPLYRDAKFEKNDIEKCHTFTQYVCVCVCVCECETLTSTYIYIYI